MKDRRTEITIETYEVLFIKSSIISRNWCASCGKEVTVINLNDASLSGLSEEDVGRQAQSGRLHLIKAVGQPLLACLNSLLQTWKGELQCNREI